MELLFTVLAIPGLLFLFSCPAQAAGFDVKATTPKTAEVNGVEIGYRVFGEGPPLLMITGYGGTMDVWPNELVEKLAASHQVILFDNRGMGYSTINDAPLTIDCMAADAAGLLDALGVERAHVFGWSLGSVVAQELALSRPGRVEKLVLYGTAADNRNMLAVIDKMGDMSPEALTAMLFPKAWAEKHPDIYATLPLPAIPPSPEMLKRQKQAIAAWPGTKDRLGDLKKDVLVLGGTDDDITPPDEGRRVAGLINGAWSAFFKGAGHWLMYQAPGDLARTVPAFLTIRQDLLSAP